MMGVDHGGPLATLLGTAVHFIDAEGTRWQVTERDCRLVPGALGPRCLVFMTDGVLRRVWEYPEEWRTLSGNGLVALSWRR
jgi:hypothetical protein